MLMRSEAYIPEDDAVALAKADQQTRSDEAVAVRLLQEGADIHKHSKGSLSEGYSILESALAAHDTPLIPLHRSMKAAEVLVRQRREEIFHFLRAQGATYWADSEEAEALLCAAAENDLMEPARELLVAGVSPNANPDTGHANYAPLAFAVENDDIPLVQLLLQDEISDEADVGASVGFGNPTAFRACRRRSGRCYGDRNRTSQGGGERHKCRNRSQRR
jgi:hypothetical protein